MGIYIIPTFNEKLAKEVMVKKLQKHFGFDITNRVFVRADVNQFNFKEDESVWRQAKGKAANYLELYWDETWICDFTEKTHPDDVEVKFLTGFKNAYEDGTVTLNTKKELEEAKARDYLEEQIAAVKKEMSEKTTEDKLAKQAVTEMLTDQKTKKDNIKKKISNKFKS